MAINEHYDEVMDIIDKLFVYIFNGLNTTYGIATAESPCSMIGFLLVVLFMQHILQVCFDELHCFWATWTSKPSSVFKLQHAVIMVLTPP